MRNNQLICDVELYAGGQPCKYIQFTMEVPEGHTADAIFQAIQSHAAQQWKDSILPGHTVRVKNIWTVGTTDADESCSE